MEGEKEEHAITLKLSYSINKYEMNKTCETILSPQLGNNYYNMKQLRCAFLNSNYYSRNQRNQLEEPTEASVEV